MEHEQSASGYSKKECEIGYKFYGLSLIKIMLLHSSSYVSCLSKKQATMIPTIHIILLK